MALQNENMVYKKKPPSLLSIFPKEVQACQDKLLGRAVVAHAFNPSTREAEAGGSL
ncbi:hypothetical protein ACRRTK_017278 [Alexandromys fortis]